VNWGTFGTWILQIVIISVVLFVLSAGFVAVREAIKERKKGGDE
jgi:hypothetical protein